MKKNLRRVILENVFLAAILVMILLLPIASFNELFTAKDAAHDDNGNGKIKYPTNKMFQKEDLFDIRKFTVTQKGNNIVFTYNMGNLANDVSFPNKFSYVNLDTYISIKGQKGLLEPLRYGAAVTFNRDYPWQYRIKINPREAYIEKLSDIENRKVDILQAVTGKENGKDVKCRLNVDGNTITFEVSKEFFDKSNLRTAGYYVMTGGYDIFGADGYRKVVKDENEWYFSGGNDGYSDTNVIDLVHPQQAMMLNLYIPPRLAVVSPVHNTLLQNLVYKEYFLTLWILAAVLVNRKFYKRRKPLKRV